MLDKGSYASPVTVSGKSDVAEAALRSAIVTCVLAPGQRLSEAGLAKDFALGRGAVRAALARLRLAGFVAPSARSGWQVAEVTAGDIREVCAARRQLELLLLTATLDAQDVQRLNGLAEMHRALAQRQAPGLDILPTIRRCERDMLALLADRLAMPTVTRWLADLWDRSARLVTFFEAGGRPNLPPGDYAGLVQAIIASRQAEALDALGAANAALEAYLVDNVLKSGAVVVDRRTGRNPADRAVPRRDRRTSNPNRTRAPQP